MNYLQSKVLLGFVLAVMYVPWNGGASLVAPSQAAVTDSGIRCRFELDKGVMFPESPRQAVVKVTLVPPPPPDRIERPHGGGRL